MADCLGNWLLVPELCHYDPGSPPEWGRYSISREGGLYRFEINWVSDRQEQQVSFSAPDDGSDSPEALTGIDRYYVTQMDPRTLDSSAESGGAVIAYARRRVSEDGALLSVYMKNTLPGRFQRVYQVYRRI